MSARGSVLLLKIVNNSGNRWIRKIASGGKSASNTIETL